MTRHPQWEARLCALVEAKRDTPHEFGSWDCLLWPAAAIKAVTGKDFGRGNRGKYRSFAGAYRHLGQMGFASPEALLDSLFDEKPIGFAGRGDIALCRTLTGDHPGVVMGDEALVVGEEGEAVGLVAVARADWVKAWAVGDHHSGPLKVRKRRRG